MFEKFEYKLEEYDGDLKRSVVEMAKDSKAHYRNEDENGIYRWASVVAPGRQGYVYELGYGEKLPNKGYRMPKEKALKMIEEGLLKVEKGKVPVQKRFITDNAKILYESMPDFSNPKFYENTLIGKTALKKFYRKVLDA